MSESDSPRRVIVTGGSGKAGRYVVQEFLAHGYQVVNLDLKPMLSPVARTLITDLTDAGQVFNALASYVGSTAASSLRPQPITAVVHLAAIPAVFLVPDNEVFRINTLSTYNVLDAASKLGIRKAIIASSETTYGLCFAYDDRDPVYFPLDEDYPVDPMDSYALSKVVNERTGRAFHLRDNMDIYAFRIGNVKEPDEYSDLIAGFADPSARKRIAWSYIDARDLAQACRLGVETDGLGYRVFNIANDEVSSDLPTHELLRRYYPDVPLSRELGERETLLCNRRAKEELGFRPTHTWMEHARG
ncbi:MAG: nucleoside-diphosphate-sugar epimerase [Chloroflexi bacterium]|jgi:nucleoside-diphosphate-sugar epimerase|nr:nucleoside-diphosphate-sugar epimerase [Chloroflexota bacterium]